MLRSRIIPCLLVHDKGLVKTVQFKTQAGKYVGDPINAVRIFNEKYVDEIMVLDIDATVQHRGPDMELIGNLAKECRMPFCYGGGVTTIEQVKKIISLGAEKVSISAAAVANPDLLSSMSKAVGAQSIILTLDIRKRGVIKPEYEIFTHNATRKTGLKLRDFLKQIKDIPYGELVINNIDRDGMMVGYDCELSDLARAETDLPITILGGAGDFNDIKLLIDRYKTIGAAAGSIFVFKGKYKAVLINYPNKDEKKLLNRSESALN